MTEVIVVREKVETHSYVALVAKHQQHKMAEVYGGALQVRLGEG
jgi:hypothetical protein